jgi:hypothetical protein
VGFDARGLEGFTGKCHFFVLLSFGPGSLGRIFYKTAVLREFYQKKKPTAEKSSVAGST